MTLDLLLINPHSANPNPMMPLGLGFLAAVAKVKIGGKSVNKAKTRYEK